MAVTFQHIKESKSDVAFHILNTLLLVLGLIVVALPLLNVLASSLSTPNAVITGRVSIWPVGWNVDAYVQIFQSRNLLMGYRNSILYTIVGTAVNIVMTVLAAYPLSVRKFVGRGLFTGLFVFTMIFTAPLIPKYLTVKDLGLLDSMWALIFPGAISVYNMIIARTYFQNSIPVEMTEAAGLDGASDFQILIRLVLPLSKSILAVLTLYYAVAHWNTYFDAYIYLSSEEKFTLQVVLRNIMSTAAALQEMSDTISADQSQRAALIEVLKYAIIVFGSLPVILLYPFVQKHFVKGVMIGSLKG